MRRVLVTGVARGVGRAVAERLIASGDSVVGCYHRSQAEAEHLQSRLGPHLSGRRVDLADAAAVGALVSSLPRPMDGVVFNAGIAIRAELASSRGSVDALLRQIELDLVAPLELCRALLEARVFADRPALVFVGSNLARRGLAGKVPYSAAKAGIEGAVRGLARELGPSGFRVNAVAPGLLRTDMTRELGEAQWVEYESRVPLRRAGTPEDVAAVIAFLLSDDAGYVTGQIIDVDGGWAI